MVAEQVAFLVPIAEKFLPFGSIDTHPANEQGDLESVLSEALQELSIGFLPSHEWADVNARVVHRNRHLRPSAIGLLGKSFRRRIGKQSAGTRIACQLCPDCSNSGTFEEMEESSAIHARSINAKLACAEKTHYRLTGWQR